MEIHQYIINYFLLDAETDIIMIKSINKNNNATAAIIIIRSLR